MYQIYADDVLIYDSTIDDFKIGKGDGTLETNKAGSFSFSVYRDHFYYDRFVKMKTVIVVKKSGRILFRGRVLSDQCDYMNRKELTCEGELNFLQDSVIRPYEFSGSPEELFTKLLQEHNAQVDPFKRFKLGEVTVIDPNNYIARSNSAYETALSNLTSRLMEDSLGGYFHITHGEDGTDPIPTLHYLADFSDVSGQDITFGVNLTDYLKKTSAKDIATAIIPLGAELENSGASETPPRLTISGVNGGVDYVYDEDAVAAYGWIFKTVEFDDVTLPENLKRKALEYLAEASRETISLELTALDLHLLDRSIDSFRIDTYVRVVSEPHSFAKTMLCGKQTFHLLAPQKDTVTLGHTYSTFSGSVAAMSSVSAQVAQTSRSLSSLASRTDRYQLAQQQLSALMAKSFGVFRTEEPLADGSTVCYLHDAPTLEESTHIWKQTAEAFAVSSDGGKTWSAGLDTSGNAVLNILSAIGIDASWIRADNLSAISAQIGPWKIDEDSLYCDFPDDSAENAFFRIRLCNPKKEYFPMIDCYKYVDGIIDSGRLSIYPGGIVAADGVWLGDYRVMNAGKHAFIKENYIGFQDGIVGKTFNLPGGLCRGSDGTVYLRLYKVNDSTTVARTLVSPTRICFVNENNAIIGGLYFDSEGKTKLYADTVRSGDGVTNYVTLGGIKFTFHGGILTGLEQV